MIDPLLTRRDVERGLTLSKAEVREPVYQLSHDMLIDGLWITAESVAQYLHLPPHRGPGLTRRKNFPRPGHWLPDGTPLWDLVAVTTWAGDKVFHRPKKEPMCLYRHWDAKGRLLYVGISCGAIRQSQHRRSSPWFREVVTITLEWFDSRPAAEAAELVAIRAEKPKHNKQGVPRVSR